MRKEIRYQDPVDESHGLRPQPRSGQVQMFYVRQGISEERHIEGKKY